MNIEKLDKKEKVQKLIGRMEALRSARSDWESDWENIGLYIHPRREFLTDVNNKSVTVGAKRYDDKPITCNQQHANGLQGNLISPSTAWFKLIFQNAKFDTIPYAKDWLEDSEQTLYGAFRNSGFYAATNEFLLDGGSICTAYMYTEYNQEKDAVSFKTMNPGEMFIAEDYFGEVNTVFREFKITASQMDEKFKDLPDEVKEELEEYAPDSEHIIIHAVFKRKNRDKDKADNKNFPYASVYIDKSSETILLESGYHEMPYLVWRYRKNGGETYGRGPGMDHLQTAIRLNKFAKGKMKIADLATDPPINAMQNMKGRLSYNPGARNYLSSMDQEPKRMDVAGNYPVTKDEIESLHEDLKEAFLVDYFLMLANSDRQMTAKEVFEKQGEKAVVIGSSVGRLNDEFLNPLIKRVFALLYRAGKLSNPPPGLLENGAKITVELVGPLAASQKYHSQTQGISRGIESLIPLMQLDPNVADTVDFDRITKEALTAAGMPQKAIREDFEIEKIRKNRAAAQQQQAQIDQMSQMAEMAPKLNQKTQQGSPLQVIEEQLAAGVKQ